MADGQILAFDGCVVERLDQARVEGEHGVRVDVLVVSQHHAPDPVHAVVVVEGKQNGFGEADHFLERDLGVPVAHHADGLEDPLEQEQGDGVVHLHDVDPVGHVIRPAICQPVLHGCHFLRPFEELFDLPFPFPVVEGEEGGQRGGGVGSFDGNEGASDFLDDVDLVVQRIGGFFEGGEILAVGWITIHGLQVGK